MFQGVGFALRPRFKISSVEVFTKPQAMRFQEIFIENRRFVQYSSEYFEPVRDGGFTAQGFVGVYIKANFDLGRQ